MTIPRIPKEYHDYFAKRGITITYREFSSSDPLANSGICAEYKIDGVQREESLKELTYTGLFDRLEKIAEQIHIDKIGIDENERREFLKKHSLASVLNSHCAVHTDEETKDYCATWLSAKS